MNKPLLILFLCIPGFIMAQETPKQKEIGLVFSDLNNFGVTYRIGTNKSLWRFNTLFASGHEQEIENEGEHYIETSGSKRYGIKIGKEFRQIINDKFMLRYGADLSFDYSHYKSERDYYFISDDRLDEQTTFSRGVNLVFGFNYALSDHILIGAEILPYFSYKNSTSTKYPQGEYKVKSNISTSGFDYGMSSSSALLSIVYKF